MPKEVEDYVLEDLKEKKPAKKSSKEEDNSIYTSFLVTEKYILEQIRVADWADGADVAPDGGYGAFIKFSRLTGNYETVNEFRYKNKTYYPIIDDVFKKNGIKLPTGVIEYKNTKEIIDQIKEFLKRNLELPSFYHGLFPNLVLFYWLYDKFPFIPYVGFIGGTGTGKTTAMMDFGNLCYKPIDTTGSLTIASLFRIATTWRGTLLIDEFYKVGEHSKEIIAFLKAGVSDRLILRVEGEKKKQVNAYIVKSPKLFTSEQAINDSGLNSRTLFVKMQKAKRRLPLFKLNHYHKEASEIRNKLLLWRLRNYDKVDLKDIEYGYKEFQNFDSRVQQILTGIYYFSNKEGKKDILEFAVQQEKETKRERLESLQGAVFEILCIIWDSGAEAQLKDVTSRLNENRKSSGYKNEMTERKIGNVVRKELGFETEKRGHDKLTYVIRNKEIEEGKRDYFGVPPSATGSAPSAKTAEKTQIEANMTENEIKELFDT